MWGCICTTSIILPSLGLWLGSTQTSIKNDFCFLVLVGLLKSWELTKQPIGFVIGTITIILGQHKANIYSTLLIAEQFYQRVKFYFFLDIFFSLWDFKLHLLGKYGIHHPTYETLLQTQICRELARHKLAFPSRKNLGSRTQLSQKVFGQHAITIPAMKYVVMMIGGKTWIIM